MPVFYTEQIGWYSSNGLILAVTSHGWHISASSNGVNGVPGSRAPPAFRTVGVLYASVDVACTGTTVFGGVSSTKCTELLASLSAFSVRLPNVSHSSSATAAFVQTITVSEACIVSTGGIFSFCRFGCDLVCRLPCNRIRHLVGGLPCDRVRLLRFAFLRCALSFPHASGRTLPTASYLTS